MNESELTKIDKVQQALIEAEHPKETKLIRDQAEAIRYYIKQQGASVEEQNRIAQVKIWAEIKTGRLLAEVPREEGGRMDLHETPLLTSRQVVGRSMTEYQVILKEAGLNEKKSQRWQAMGRLPDKTIENYFEKCDLDRKEITSSGVLKLAKEDKIEEHAIVTVQQLESSFTSPPVYHADCTEFLASFDDNHFDLLLTDPPYRTDIDNIADFAKSWLPLALSKIKPTGRAYICIGAYPDELKAYLDILLNQDKFILDNPLIWTYRNTLGQTPKMKYNLNYQIVLHLYSTKSTELDTSITNEIFSVQDINAPDGRIGNRYHTWQKPDELGRRFVVHSTKPGDRIIDPFVCTGTFLIVAAQLDRDPIGCDISANNLKIAKQRGCNVIFEGFQGCKC